MVPFASRALGEAALTVCDLARLHVLEPLVAGADLPLLRLANAAVKNSLSLAEALSLEQEPEGYAGLALPRTEVHLGLAELGLRGDDDGEEACSSSGSGDEEDEEGDEEDEEDDEEDEEGDEEDGEEDEDQ